jgi:peptidoglycan/LPS O-acetylase OafA/YrhL
MSLLRGLASLQVAAAHLRAEVFPGFGTVGKPPLLYKGLAFSTGFSYLAVILFFLLSGWLVGGSFLNKLDSDRPFRHYAIDRLSRLWVVLVPLFMVMLATGVAVGTLDPAHVSFIASKPYSVIAVLGNMVGLQTIVVPPFGGNFPLWSLANETWYYVLFPLCVVVWRGRTMVSRVAAVLTIGAIVHLVHGTIILYFSIWLLGVAFSRLRIEAGPILHSTLLLLIGTAVYIRMRGRADITLESFGQYLLFSLVCALFLSSMQFQRMPAPMSKWLDSGSRFFANISFTLYVLHVPMIAVMWHLVRSWLNTGQLSPYNPSHYLIYAAMYLMLLIGAYGFYRAFEAKTPRVPQWLKTRILAEMNPVRS